MKKYCIYLIAIVFLLTCTACGNSDVELQRQYNAGYSDGYEEGYRDGGNDGYSSLDSDELIYSYEEAVLKAARYGWHPEEALCVIEDHINGKYVSKQDLANALDSLSVYFYETDALIYDYY